jgi:hypothetical protein
MLQQTESTEKTRNEAETSERGMAQQLFDVEASAQHLRDRGAHAATVYLVRTLISTGRVPHIRVGRRLYVTRASWDAWLAKSERRRRA